MMTVHFFSRLVCSWFVFALPLFRSFQALRHRPFSEPDVDRLFKYWIVIGILMAFEYSAEALVSWFPFYWELKLLLLLFISLPQLQGSTYVYDTWLAPFLIRNESHIDHQIELARENFLEFFQSRVHTIFDRITGASKSQRASGQEGDAEPQPPSSIQNAAHMAMGYLTAHGFSLAGKGDATRPASSRTASGSSQRVSSASASSTSIHATSMGDVGHRAGFATESQASFPVTPEQIYQAQASKHSTPKDASTPIFPEPEHY
ncbi:hypothetical protein ACEPAG_436 [Sanghuangporus baumii]